MPTIAEKIVARLNEQDAYDFGLSNSDARLVGDCVNFTYPAPVLGGACHGVIRTYDDGRVFDDTAKVMFDSYEEWVEDLESMMEEV